MARAEWIRVEVVYALPQRQVLRRMRVPAGTTAIEAVRRSGLAREHPDIDLGTVTLGVYARRVAHETRLREGDRVEIYRPLQVDPKAVRRERAGKARPRPA